MVQLNLSLSTEEQSLIYLPLPLTGDPGVMVDEATNDLIYLPLPLTGDPGVIVDEATNDL